MTKYRAQSANVLNEADRFEQSLNVTLFNMEQDQRLWGYNPKVEWRPGDPIYKDPRTVFQYQPQHGDINFDTGCWGNHVRPMIEEYIDGAVPHPMRCRSCEVSWEDRADDNCWMCGESCPRSVKKLWDPTISFDGHDLFVERYVAYSNADAELVVRMYDDMQRSLARQMQQMWADIEENMLAIGDGARRATQRFSILQDAVQEANTTIQGFRPRFTFIDEIQMPAIEPVRFEVAGVELPSNWADLRLDIPLPAVPAPPDYAEWRAYERAYISTPRRSRRE